MKESNMNNNLQEAFPIPEDSIYLDQDLELSKRLAFLLGAKTLMLFCSNRSLTP